MPFYKVRTKSIILIFSKLYFLKKIFFHFQYFFKKQHSHIKKSMRGSQYDTQCHHTEYRCRNYYVQIIFFQQKTDQSE